jgi:hypothetical protein
METELIDKLFLELSQVTTARTKRELELEGDVEDLRRALGDLVGAESRDELMKIKDGLKQIPVPSDELPAMMNAIDLLLEFTEPA